MKLIRYVGLLVGWLMFVCLSGCGGDGVNAGGSSSATIKGVVYDASGNVLAGASVAVGSASTSSAADGSYSLTVTPGASLKVVASKTGMVSTFSMITLANGQTQVVDFALRAVGKSNDLTGMWTTQSVADDSRGATVTLPAGSLVLEGTSTVVDTATVEVTSVQPGDAKYTASFPGSFVGTKDGADVAIESFGYVKIDITSGGQKCNLGAGKTAEIAIPVVAGGDPGTATIDLWSLDETTGKWLYEGQATRDATVTPVVYRASVSHFSTYNLDRPIPDAIPFNITVKTAAGATVAGANVVIASVSSSGGRWEGRGFTDASGVVRFPSVAPGSVSVNVVHGNQAGNGYAYEIDNGEANMTIALYNAVQRSFTVVYDDGSVEKPAANVSVSVFSESPNGHSFASGVTDAQGLVTLTLKDGLSFYNYYANATINSVAYSVSGNASSVAGLPAKWVMLPSVAQ